MVVNGDFAAEKVSINIVSGDVAASIGCECRCYPRHYVMRDCRGTSVVLSKKRAQHNAQL